MTSTFYKQQYSMPQNIQQNKTNNNNTMRRDEVQARSFDSTRSDLSEESRDVIIGNQWAVLGRIGEGSFGEVFEAEDIHTFERLAIKREPIKLKHPQIKHESDIYNILAGGPGIPKCHWHGQHEKFDCIVIDLLGPNLNQLKQATQRFPVHIVIQLGIQMVTIMEHIHSRGLVYRDVKPDNFLFSAKCHLPEPEMIETTDEYGMPHTKYNYPTCEQVFRQWNTLNPQLFIVDFGLTTHWRDPITGKPYPDGKRHYKNKTGTARYASLNVHRGRSHSRRDDIEALGYLILDMIFGTLPWTGIQARNSRAGWDRMKQIKEDTFMSDFCAGLPQGILQFVEYSRKLRFAEEPNYELLRNFLQGSLAHGKYSEPVRSPFGGHTERRWVPEKQEQDNTPRPNSNTRGQHYYESSYQELIAKNRKKQTRVGWNSHRHDNAPWVPVTDWDTTVDNTKQQSWGDNQVEGWANVKEPDWASTVVKPWD